MYNTQRFFTEDLHDSFKNNYINYTNKKKHYFDEENLIFVSHRRSETYRNNITSRIELE